MIQDLNFFIDPRAIARASPNNLIQTADRCAPTQTRVPPGAADVRVDTKTERRPL
jgi:hypothetical protein